MNFAFGQLGTSLFSRSRLLFVVVGGIGIMSSPPTPETASVLAPSTPERATVLCSVDRDAELVPPADVSRELASLTLLEKGEEEEASAPSTSSPSLVTLVSADGFRLTVPRRVAEESGTVRQLLLSRGEREGDGRKKLREPLLETNPVLFFFLSFRPLTFSFSSPTPPLHGST